MYKFFQKPWFFGFSFDSNSTSDEWQPQINLPNRSYKVHVHLILQRVRHSLYDQLELDVNCCQIIVIMWNSLQSEWYLSLAWSVSKWALISQSYCHKINCHDIFSQLKHEKDVEKSLKSAPTTPNSSDLSFGTDCSHSQSL
jgi:hypothetical protein